MASLEEALRKAESDLAVAEKLAEGAGKKPNTQHAAALAEAEAEVELAKTVVKVIQSARNASQYPRDHRPIQRMCPIHRPAGCTPEDVIARSCPSECWPASSLRDYRLALDARR